MRAALVAGLLIATAVLGGCVNLPKDGKDDVNGASVTIPTQGTGPNPTLLPTLAMSVSSTSPKWLAPGSSLDLSATVPSGAKGPVTFVWAIGAYPGTVAAPAVAFDTGSKTPADYIASNASKSIKFTSAGVFQMHCHPHPNMRSNVSVVDGYQGPSSVEVQIYDFGYAPQNIVVGVNTTVVYKNVGVQPHTATILSAEPPLKALSLKDAKGNVTVAGSGWQRVRAYALDAEGHMGNATLDVYVAPYPAFTKAPKTMSFPAGLGPAATQGTTVVGPQTDSFATDHNGTIFLNYTAKDAADSGVAQVEVHLKQSGETQDTLTDSGKGKGNLVVHAPADSYTLSVLVTQGVNVEVTYTIEVVYDAPTPPAPVMAGAGGGDGHGGHKH